MKIIDIKNLPTKFPVSWIFITLLLYDGGYSDYIVGAVFTITFLILCVFIKEQATGTSVDIFKNESDEKINSDI